MKTNDDNHFNLDLEKTKISCVEKWKWRDLCLWKNIRGNFIVLNDQFLAWSLKLVWFQFTEASHKDFTPLVSYTFSKLAISKNLEKYL